MKSVIFELYTKLSGGGRNAHIEVTIDSRVRDDSGHSRTIVELIHEGYIKPGIIDNPDIVQLKYDTLSPTYYASIYKDAPKVGKKNLLEFENEADDSDDIEFTFNDNDMLFNF